MVMVLWLGCFVVDYLCSGCDWSLNIICGGLFLFLYNDLKLVVLEKKVVLLYYYYDNLIQFLKCSQSEYLVVMSICNVGNIDLKVLLWYYEECNSFVMVVYKCVDLVSLIFENIIL